LAFWSALVGGCGRAGTEAISGCVLSEAAGPAGKPPASPLSPPSMLEGSRLSIVEHAPNPPATMAATARRKAILANAFGIGTLHAP
jgi:hypothetical protein